MGVELELAVIRLALRSDEERLPEGRYLALNVSPAVLEHDDLAFAIARHDTGRPLVVEITEHQPVEDYVKLCASLDRLRELGVRVAVDDVGSGFASFRHVTRVNPDILKLDRTLVCGIDDDPVRQSLATRDRRLRQGRRRRRRLRGHRERERALLPQGPRRGLRPGLLPRAPEPRHGRRRVPELAGVS